MDNDSGILDATDEPYKDTSGKYINTLNFTGLFFPMNGLASYCYLKDYKALKERTYAIF